jgi:hypothetical protein
MDIINILEEENEEENDIDFLENRQVEENYIDINYLLDDEEEEDMTVNAITYHKLYMTILRVGGIYSLIIGFITLLVGLIVDKNNQEMKCQNGYYAFYISEFILMFVVFIILFFIFTRIDYNMKNVNYLEYESSIKYIFLTFLTFLVSLSIACGGLYWIYSPKIELTCGDYIFYIFLKYIFLMQVFTTIIFILIIIFVLSNYQKVVTTVPVLEENSVFFSKDDLPEKYRNEKCVICLVEFSETKKSFRQLTKCEHVYHKNCIDKWVLEGNLNCPICRGDL